MTQTHQISMKANSTARPKAVKIMLKALSWGLLCMMACWTMAAPSIKPANTATDLQSSWQPPAVQDPVLRRKYPQLFDPSTAGLGMCWERAGAQYHIDPWLLVAIAHGESSFNIGAQHMNNNETTDLGIMQINTVWLPELEKRGISRQRLLNPCQNIFVGAWIFKRGINQFGNNVDGFGAYHAPSNVALRRQYGRRLIETYMQLRHDFRVPQPNDPIDDRGSRAR